MSKVAVQIQEISGYNANLHKLGLFFPYTVQADRDNRHYDFSIEIKDLSGKPDCKIGDFANNIWYRTPAALKNNWQGYSTYKKLALAVQKVLENNQFENITWYLE